MTGRLYAALVALHGHLAVLGLAVLLHPVITLGRRHLSPRTVLTADLGALLLAAPAALGWLLYPTYRARIKPALWLSEPAVALRFETKEHLASAAVVLAICGAATLRLAGGGEAGRRAARTLLALAWLLGVCAALLGAFVNSAAHPGF